jgi:hypothetical protein
MVNLGSVMSFLVHVHMTFAPDANLKALWIEINVAYDELDIPAGKRFGSMRMSMFSKAREREFR